MDTPPTATLADQVLYIPFNGTVADITGNATVTSQQLSFVTDRFGVLSYAGYFNGATAGGTGDVVEISGE